MASQQRAKLIKAVSTANLALVPPQFPSGRRILLAHDGRQIWNFAVSLLHNFGHAVHSVTSGRDALEVLQHNHFDLVVVCEELTDIDGIGFIVKCRQTCAKVKLAFISDTWRDASLYQELRKQFGVSLVVHRPLKPSLFAMQIESIFGESFSESDETEEHEERSRFEDLRAKYSRLLPARIGKLDELLQQYRDTSSFSALEESLRLAHNLRGTASSCGFRSIGQAAGTLEKILLSVGAPSNGVPTIRIDWHQINAVVAFLKEQATKALAEYENHTSTGLTIFTEDSGKARVLIASPEPDPIAGLQLDPMIHLTHVNTCGAALRTAKGTTFDAALIDLAFGSSAYNLSKELRGLPGFDNIPLGFISSNAPHDRAESTRAGGSLFLERPINGRVLKGAAKYLISIRQGGRPRILVVDDDTDFTQIITATLGSHGMLVRAVHEPDAILSNMQEFAPDLVLLDVLMPGISGFDVCRKIKAVPRWRDTPVLFLTAQTGVDARVSAFESGGDDYLAKPIVEIELITRIRLRLERAKLLKERGDRDILSGLLLRRAFAEQLNALVSESSRHAFVFSLCFLDVDHFKRVNDTYGHQAGDAVLAHLGHLLSQRFRVEDLRGRWGGEEFVLAFPHATADVMRGAIARVLEEFRTTEFEGEAGEKFTVTFSAGMASFPDDGKTAKELLQVADRRLYAAKDGGRNIIIVED